MVKANKRLGSNKYLKVLTIVIADGLASLLHNCTDYSHSLKKSVEHGQQMALTDSILLLPTSSKHGR